MNNNANISNEVLEQIDIIINNNKEPNADATNRIGDLLNEKHGSYMMTAELILNYFDYCLINKNIDIKKFKKLLNTFVSHIDKKSHNGIKEKTKLLQNIKNKPYYLILLDNISNYSSYILFGYLKEDFLLQSKEFQNRMLAKLNKENITSKRKKNNNIKDDESIDENNDYIYTGEEDKSFDMEETYNPKDIISNSNNYINIDYDMDLVNEINELFHSPSK